MTHLKKIDFFMNKLNEMKEDLMGDMDLKVYIQTFTFTERKKVITSK